MQAKQVDLASRGARSPRDRLVASLPRCEKHGKLAKMQVVKNFLKSNYGRPFFVCSDQSNSCSFWVWGDVQHVAKPKCHHGFPCVIRKVKKETINKDRLFFCCTQKDSCNYFEWVHEKPYCSAGLPQAEIKQDKKRKNNTQQRILSTISLAWRVVFNQVYSVIKNILFEQF